MDINGMKYRVQKAVAKEYSDGTSAHLFTGG